MVDLSDKGSGSEDMISQTPTPDQVSSESSQNQLKSCADCGTTKTPLWRGGPAGPKSLCNACGIRSRKKRRALLGLNKDDKISKKSGNKTIQNQSSNNSGTTSSGESTSNNSGKNQNSGSSSSSSSLKRRNLLPFGSEVVLQRPRSTSTTPRRKLGEEEQAAFLLMALSCGSVYA